MRIFAWIDKTNLFFVGRCSMLGSPYINNCDYDGAGAALNQIYGKLKAPVSSAPQGNVSPHPQFQKVFGGLKLLRLSRSIKLNTPPRVGPSVQCPSHLKAMLTSQLLVKMVLLASSMLLTTDAAKLLLVCGAIIP